MSRRVWAALVAAAVTLAGGVGACFPDYTVSSTSDGGGGDGTLADGVTDGLADGPGADGSPVSDGAFADRADAASLGDGSMPPADGGGDTNTVGDAPVTGPVVRIDGGTFAFQVYDRDGGLVDATATLDYTLVVDPYEVTVGRFTSWVAAGKQVPEAGTSLDPRYAQTMTWQSAWNGPVAGDDYEDAGCNQPGGKGPTFGKDAGFPVNCVTWEHALAFCWWDGHRRLLTDTEWRVVATSGGREAPYPWGASASLDCNHVTFNDGTECGFPVVVGTASQGATRDGVYDIVGSVSEWLWDAYGNVYTYPPSPGTDYAGPPVGSPPVSRLWIGSDYAGNDTIAPEYQFQTFQPGPEFSSTPEMGFDTLGFRCATSAP